MSHEWKRDNVSAILNNSEHIMFKQLRSIKLIFYGTPGAGKTTLRKQLLRVVEGVGLQPRGSNIEPSTNIAEVCGPIFVQRIMMTNEGSNEWKWTRQNLDDIGKSLIQCLGNTKLHCDTESNDLPEESLIKYVTKNYDGQQNSSLESQHSVGSRDLGADSPPMKVLTEETRKQFHPSETFETNEIQKLYTTDIDITELFRNAIKTGKWEEVVGALNIDKATFLQIIDGGGQPSFQEIFPLLISGPSLTVLVFKLTDDLEALHPVQYQTESQLEGQTVWQDTYVVKDIISHALASFAVSQKDTLLPFPCKILLIGTHKDKLEVSQEPQSDKERNKKAQIESIAMKLYGWLHQSKAFESIQVQSMEDLITGIDNFSQHDIVLVKKKIEELILQIESQDVPASWMVFDFVLHKFAEMEKLCKIGTSDCKNIAHVCGITENINGVLHYLHYEAGTLLYYSDIPGLNEYVITDFQLIFDSISKIIIQYFENSISGPHLKHKKLFTQKGKFDASVLRGVEGCLKVQELISLLHHRHIISKMEGTNMYFMPSVLPKDRLSCNLSDKSLCYLVLFDHGYCPVGLFCAATIKLIVSHKWELNKGASQFRNKIDFFCTCSGKLYNVIFSEFSAHYEVCLMGDALPEVKYEVYQDMNDVISTVCKDMKYQSPTYGFYCPKKCMNENGSYVHDPHPATCAFNDESQHMICYYSGTPSDLSEEHKQWFKQEQKMSHKQKRDNYSIPDPPIEVTAQPTSSKSIKVSWTLPRNISKRGAIQGYELSYSKSKSSTSVLNVGVTTFDEITGLQPYTTYNISVRTRAAGEYSEYSSPCTATTKEDVPSAPIAIVADGITATSMTLSWQPPQDANGIIRNYQVSYTPHDGSECIHDMAGDITTTELTSLKPHTKYDICVRAKTVEFGEYSSVITKTTLPDEVFEEKMAIILDRYKDVSFRELKVGKMIFYGIPRSGKTILRKQLMKSIDNRLEDCSTSEPSTNIGEICDPILVNHVLAKSEEGNEWKWTIQKLDELAKTLLQSIDIELSRNEGKQKELVIAETTKPDPPHDSSTPKEQHTDEANPITDTKLLSGSDEPSTQTLAEETNFQVTRSAVADKSALTENSTVAAKEENPDLDLKKCFLSAVKTGKWEEVRQALHFLDNAMLLQVIDCGGQPTFQEIFPFLISGPSVTLLIFNLSEDLTHSHRVRYLQNQHEEETTWQEQTYVPKQFILQAISSHFKEDSKLLLIGTHKDVFGDSEVNRQEGFKTVATTLLNLLESSKEFKDSQHFQDFFIGIGFQPKHLQSTELQANIIEQQDISQVKNKIEKLIAMIQPADTQGIPAPWLVFSFILHKYATSKKLGKLEIETCHYIAKKCGIKNDDIDFALVFLHRNTGTVLYYPHISELKNFVFTDFQPIIDSVSSIVINYFNENLEHEGPNVRKGLLKIASVRKIDGYLEADELVSLLKHRHIISQMNRDTLFMPSLLPNSELSDNTPNNVLSFLVRFKNGYCPIGIFCAVSTRLANTKNWKINESFLQFRNKICFYYVRLRVSYGITFTAFYSYYRVGIDETNVSSEVRFNICKDVIEGFREVCKDLKNALPLFDFYQKTEGGNERLVSFDTQSELTEQQKAWSQQIESEELRNDHCRSFTIINGKADVFDLKEYGLTISFNSDCLPPNLKKCEIFISADLTTDIPLPSRSLLVSGVYHITTIPFIDHLNQPIELSMEHCANDLNNLCFVVAKDQNQQKFEYMEGGTFEIQATTGRRIGRICVSSFSIWTAVKRWPQQVCGWFTGRDNTSNGPEVNAYCGSVFYDDSTFPYRNIHFVITKDLQLAKDLIANEIQLTKAGDLSIEFGESQGSERQVLLVIPKETIGKGWVLVPLAEPTEIKQKHVDEFGRGKRPPQCIFSAQWTREDLHPTIHNETIRLLGTRNTQSVTVTCVTDGNRHISRRTHTEISQAKKLEGFLECSEKDIYKIAGYDFNWRRVGQRLMCDQKVRDIDREGGSEEEKKEKMLLEWKRTKSRDATYQALVKGLRAIENNATADQVEEIERKSKRQRVK